MRQYTIEDAKRLITDFCETEYGTENVDFSNLDWHMSMSEYVELVKHKEDTICC